MPGEGERIRGENLIREMKAQKDVPELLEQQTKCSRGEHEAEAEDVIALRDFRTGRDWEYRLCRHCRCLFVEKP